MAWPLNGLPVPPTFLKKLFFPKDANDYRHPWMQKGAVVYIINIGTLGEGQFLQKSLILWLCSLIEDTGLKMGTDNVKNTLEYLLGNGNCKRSELQYKYSLVEEVKIQSCCSPRSIIWDEKQKSQCLETEIKQCQIFRKNHRWEMERNDFPVFPQWTVFGCNHP